MGRDIRLNVFDDERASQEVLEAARVVSRWNAL